MGRFVSTITFDHNENFSCVFRNWKAVNSDNQFLHGYSLSIKIVFESWMLDDQNQNLNDELITAIRDYLKENFSFVTYVSEDDPAIDHFRNLESQNVIKLKILPAVGLEKFAEKIFNDVRDILAIQQVDRLTVKTVEVREHSGGSSLFIE